MLSVALTPPLCTTDGTLRGSQWAIDYAYVLYGYAYACTSVRTHRPAGRHCGRVAASRRGLLSTTTSSGTTQPLPTRLGLLARQWLVAAMH